MIMKAKVLNLKGEVTEEIELPEVFAEEFRPDIIKRAVLALQSHRRQPYGPNPLSGVDYSWENWGPGHGYARVPRWKLGRRAVVVPQAVGGRRAHPPKPERKWAEKINKKEMRKALKSAIAATANEELVRQRSHVFEGELPKVVSNELESVKRTKDVAEVFRAIGVYADVERAKERKRYRAGRGKMRGRRYVKKKSVLLVVGKDDGVVKAAKNLPGVDAVVVKDLNVELLAPGCHPGRLTVWTKSAVEYLGEWLC
ncbi:MAG: 50S ribosomal protein L4 [Archaeoglobus fulgidus]|jgi:large subunit ribosomal protein L4e|nr:50S ribosomal protein L4P [Archaeoglobus fulgidus DSM 8774]KUJ93925.1 MAG: 50S ribosomal protein L4 [Archaeoglobus fulgidus]KUK07448.1 MAG: 50S ribosomal protein L4 [Archaeoglobus fulgidus]